ncbi:type I phosphomannose isomerase catalytic subunit [Formosa haliotis]|uniref:type I phosphomannose isomerase catalytic subunit n=1 Tax=Formosa haliotis TaxID=1555194 RepID=UPI000826DC7B|nr:type I phosphomannose isomerase catalytic subunit [Formosa haliotis]
MKNLIYPLKFEPILKEKIWGGEKLNTLLNKKSTLPNIGESWEVSDVDGEPSVVANGSLKGKTLKELLLEYKEDFIGVQNHRIFGEKFPLLIKYIDAKEDLSIQLHPNDELAGKRHNSFGKTEMWYVMQADEDSKLIIGFKENMSPGIYLEHLENKTLPEILNTERVKPGDAFFIEVGRVHAIGAGVMLAEIQQTSDITYRVYDWERVDAEGNERELHTELALDAIDFEMTGDFKMPYEKIQNESSEMISCPYFTTNFLEVTDTVTKENYHDSFIIYMCVEGEAEITTNGNSETIKTGETILLPAAAKSYEITAKQAKLLEVYV